MRVHSSMHCSTGHSYSATSQCHARLDPATVDVVHITPYGRRMMQRSRMLRMQRQCYTVFNNNWQHEHLLCFCEKASNVFGNSLVSKVSKVSNLKMLSVQAGTVQAFVAMWSNMLLKKVASLNWKVLVKVKYWIYSSDLCTNILFLLIQPIIHARITIVGAVISAFLFPKTATLMKSKPLVPVH